MKLGLQVCLVFFHIVLCSLANNDPGIIKPSSSAFIENKGQIIDQNNKPNAAVLYLLNTPGMNVQLRRGGFSYDLYSITDAGCGMRDTRCEIRDARTSYPGSFPDIHKVTDPESRIPDPASRIAFHRIDFDLLASNPACEIITSDPSSDYLNYYTAGTPVEGVTNVHSFKTVTYKNIYPGIDLEFVTGDENQFKYTFIIRPGGSLSSIRFKVSGPDNIIEKGNDLLISTNAGDLEERIPLCYYTISDNELKTPVTCRFKKEFNNLYTFSSADVIPENAILCIDPIPTRRWGTYFGGLQSETSGINNCQIDDSGNIFFSGVTWSSTNIATAGAYQTVLTGTEDVFLTKFSATGQQLWGTYYGGDQGADGGGLGLDVDDNLYLCGYTSSTTNMATPGAFQTILRGESDAFLAKFTPAGFRIWGTYYGGNEGSFPGWDQFSHCSIDSAGSIYCFGQTSSPDYISTPGAAQTVFGGMHDDMLVKFTSDGQRVWGTYYGGSENEVSAKGTIGKNGMIYMSGATFSTNNISTPGSYQPAISGFWDAFMACFLPDGSRQWGTYFGGTADDISYGCAADTGTCIYLYGMTSSTSGIATPGVFQSNVIGGNSGYVEKFSSDGQRLWGTYYGASLELNGLAVDDSGYVFIASHCFGQDPSNFSTGAYQTIFRDGNSDANLAKLTGDGQRVWGTYYGGTDFDYGYSVAVDHYDNIYFTGYTSSENNSDNNTSLCSRNALANYIATSGSHQPNLSGWSDIFLVKFADCWSPDTALTIYGPETLCQNTTGIVFSIDPIPAATDYQWCVTNNLTITSGQHTTSITVNVGSAFGTDTISVFGMNSCDNGFPKRITRRVYAHPVPVITGNTSPMTGSVYTYSTATGMTNYQWTFSPGGTLISGGGNADPSIDIQWNSAGPQWVRVNYVDDNGCASLVPTQLDINVTTTVTIDFAAPDTVCTGAQINVTNLTQGGTTFYWNFCSGNVNADPTGVNIGNPGGLLDSPSLIALARQGNDCFSFLTNSGLNNHGVIRNYHGNSFKNNPVTSEWLGSFGMLDPRGIQVKEESGQWYAFVVNQVSIKRLNFGNSLMNTPTVTDIGPFSIVQGQYDLVMAKDGANWIGLVSCVSVNKIVLLNFGPNLTNIPAETDLGDCGGTITEPSSIRLVQENGQWYALVMAGGNTMARLDFGNSLLNTPAATNLGNPGGIISGIGLALIHDCGSTSGYWVNHTPVSQLGKLIFPSGITGSATGTILGNTGDLDGPTAFSEIIREGDTLYTYVVNFTNATLTRLTFLPCTSASVPSSTLFSPPPFSYNESGTYNIHLVVDEGMPSMGSMCKPVVVMDPQVVSLGNDLSICPGGSTTLDAGPGFTGYLWSTGATTRTISVFSSGTYWITAFRWGCSTSDTVIVSLFPTPQVNLGPDTTVCQGQTHTFDAGPYAGCTYQWDNLTTGQLNIGSGQTYTTGQAGQYMATLRDDHGCMSHDMVNLSIVPADTVRVTVSASANPVCEGTEVVYTAAAMHGGSAPHYQWIVNGNPFGPDLSSIIYSPSSGDSIRCILTSSETCVINNPASSIQHQMVVTPRLPVSITISPSANPVCQGTSVTFTATPVNGGSTPHYQWIVNGNPFGPDLSSIIYSPSNGDSIRCILTSSETCVTNNPASSIQHQMVVLTTPSVTFTPCFDTITTTNAKPFKLKGGIPLGGTYSGTGITNGIFYPAIAGVGTHQINYSYTNAALCNSTNHCSLLILNSSFFICGNDLTDIRDNKIYPTVVIGSQCWFTTDLNYGNVISPGQHQRDNCIPERYKNPASGIPHPASFYQWDELMRYDDTPGQQGLCPPGWHVPSESDWNILFASFTSNAFAGAPLKYDGYSGFNAELGGAGLFNRNWYFDGFATLFWSSTAHGPDKAWAHGLNDFDPSVAAYPSFRSNGFAVRCMKD